MSKYYSLKNEGRSSAEKCEKWMRWFEKRWEKLFKDAAEHGEFSVHLGLPVKPSAGPEERGELRRIRAELRRRLPGCDVSFVEEDYEGRITHSMEISWTNVTGLGETISTDETPVDSTAKTTSTPDNPPPSDDSTQPPLPHTE